MKILCTVVEGMTWARRPPTLARSTLQKRRLGLVSNSLSG